VIRFKKTIFIFLILFSFDSVFAGVNDTIILNGEVARKLSDYGFFEDLVSQYPSKEVLPY